MEKTKVFAIQEVIRKGEQKRYRDTEIAFSDINGAAEFVHQFRNYHVRYTYKNQDKTKDMKVYNTYEHFVSENPKMEIDRLKDEQDGILVEFPFSVSIRNKEEGTIRLTKLVPLNLLFVFICRIEEDYINILLTPDEYIKIKKDQFGAIDKSVSEAKKEYKAIDQQIAKIKDLYIPMKNPSEKKIDLEEVYRAFEEE